MPEADSKLIILAKAPVPGNVKTRLQPTVSPEEAAKLQAFFIQQTLALASSLKGVDVELRCTPDASHPIFQQCAHQHKVTLKQQQGKNLGERMANALQEALTNYQQVVVIGTDCPELTPDYLSDALLQLKQGSMVVIGPASDGGYVLLGLRRFSPLLFTDINWGSDQVLFETCQKLQQLGWEWDELSTLRDIDTPADLLDFPEIMSTAGLALNIRDVQKS
jgi:rSAM/selenodomain-associated transferase 1